MSAAGDLLAKGGNVAEQIAVWNVLGQVAGTVMQPALDELAVVVNTAHPVTRLSPPDAATAANRSFIDIATAEAEAAASGTDATRFAVMRLLAGTAPGPQQLAEGLRRGIITEQGQGGDSTSFQQGIAEGNLLDKWAPLIKALSVIWPTPDLALNALLEGQLPEAEARALYAKLGGDPEFFTVEYDTRGSAPTPVEAAEMLRRGIIPEGGSGPDVTSFHQAFLEGPWRDKWESAYLALAKIWPTPPLALNALLKGQLTESEARSLYEKLGGDIQFFTVEHDTAGNAPTPNEALSLANRGIIPWNGTGPDVVSYEQAFREGPWRNKWEPAFKALAEYIPPPETVRTLLEQGAIDHAQASKWWGEYGLAADTVQSYLAAAAFNNTAATRGLTESSVLDMYYAQLMSEADAKKLLTLFGTPAANQDLMLAYVDMRRAIAAQTAVVTRIQSLYIGRKISTQTARDALTRDKVPPESIDGIIATWDIAASANVKTLTATEIVDAWYYKVFTQDEAMTELQAIGYTPFDAWALLSNKAKAPLPGKPAKTVAPPAGAVIPGVT